MYYKKKIVLVIFIMIMAFPFMSYALGTPIITEIIPSEKKIKIRWGKISEADGYKIYYWKSSNDQDSNEIIITNNDIVEQVIPEDENIFLSTDTEYNIEIIAYTNDPDEESDPSDIKTTRTTDMDLDTPTGFDISSLGDITNETISFTWNKNTEKDFDHYKIEYGTSSGVYNSEIDNIDSDTSDYKIENLDAATRYYFTIRAVDISGNESDPAVELIVDTLVDENAPNTPKKLNLLISEPQEVTVSFTSNNEGMVDLKEHMVYYDTSFDGLLNDEGETIALKTSYTFPGLTLGATYYFAVTAKDKTGNESDKSKIALIKIEDIKGLLGNTESFEGGCFVDSAFTNQTSFIRVAVIVVTSFLSIVMCMAFRRKKTVLYGIALLLITTGTSYSEENNTFGIKFAYNIPSENKHKDIYDDMLHFSMFYDRQLLNHVSIDAEVGLINEHGYAVTESGNKTRVKTDLLLIPVSVSLNINFQLFSLINTYMGGGLDYWYYRESSDFGENDASEEDELGVGGYHGKLGIKFYSDDDWFYHKRAGVLIEAVYSKIDRFGSNSLDLGGWAFHAGMFYSF